ncbi:unnamed protein product [Toxocara canis]|uniref:Secreted protein n=1 Tax=Toxocara canis TaxID=6265 RepID=A0A183V2S0_TOXCA|nr:unnamed protein product [Toxocara canis]
MSIWDKVSGCMRYPVTQFFVATVIVSVLLEGRTRLTQLAVRRPIRCSPLKLLDRQCMPDRDILCKEFDFEAIQLLLPSLGCGG